MTDRSTRAQGDPYGLNAAIEAYHDRAERATQNAAPATVQDRPVTSTCRRCGRTIFVGSHTQSEQLTSGFQCAGLMVKSCAESLKTHGKFGQRRAAQVRPIGATP